jgi:hypothetical protein
MAARSPRFRADGSMLFGDPRRFLLQSLHFRALAFQRFFTLRAQRFLLFHRRAIALALLGRFLRVAT